MTTARQWRNWLLAAAAGTVVAALLAGAIMGARVAGIATAYYAKTLCSGVFVSRRAQETIIAQDIHPKVERLPGSFAPRIDIGAGLVNVAYLGLIEREALYRPGLGCTLLMGADAEKLRQQPKGIAPSGVTVAAVPVFAEAPSSSSLNRVLERAFSEQAGQGGRGTRAIVILHRGRIAAERYADGITRDMPLIGWSLGKTVVNALTGILVEQGKFSIDAEALYPAWSGKDDKRAKITPRHLLRMTSGLDFGDNREALLSAAKVMLFDSADAASVALAAPASGPPGASWRYGSGSTILLCRLLSKAAGEGAPALGLARKQLFAPLGMSSAVIEADASGTPLGPAFVYASARDWARFGQFLLQDGIWQGARLLPQGWMAFSAEPTTQSANRYGAHLWRRTPDFLRPKGAREITLPADTMLMLGVDGQMVAIVPSLELVAVRLGMTTRRAAFDPDGLLSEIVAALTQPSG